MVLDAITRNCKEDSDLVRTQRKGVFFGNVIERGEYWSVVHWNNESVPELCKSDKLLVEDWFGEITVWINARNCKD